MRRAVIGGHQAGLAADGRDAKTARLFEYLASEQFRQAIGGLVSRTMEAQRLLHVEQRTHAKGWERREEIYGEIGRGLAAIDERVRAIIEGSEEAGRKVRVLRAARP